MKIVLTRIIILDFKESDQFFPEYILFMNSTRKPHKIDDNFAILEISPKTKRVRIGVGNESTQSLTNTIKFSISQGQKVLDVRTTPDQIWIQADNARLTMLKPNHDSQAIDWKQTYLSYRGTNLTFSTFDVFRIPGANDNQTYPCRADKCDQVCRDETQHIFEADTKIKSDDGNYVCSCSRDFNQDTKYSEQCHQLATCHHKTLMCDYDETADWSANANYKCITRDKFCDGTQQCDDGFDESEKICEFTTRHTCPNNTFACPMDRMCLNLTNVCDGNHDCAIQTDYLNITFFSFLPIPHSDEYPTFCKVFDCPKGSKKCKNGYQCLIDAKWNDGVADCKETEDDELVTCGEGFFKCNDKKCIPSKWVCDGDQDCAKGEDEQNCTSCNGNGFFCGVGSKKCLPTKDVCDGFSDCHNGSDEHDDCGGDYNEKHGRFPNHRHSSINITNDMEYTSRGASQFCDNSKELHCRNPWRAFGAGVACVDFKLVCNGKPDCLYSDDELSFPRDRGAGNVTILHEDDQCTSSCNDLETKRQRGQWNCDGECFPSPNGPMCACPNGMYWDTAVFKCHDVDECELHDRCQQQCVNLIGGFECKCADGYIKEGLGTCRSKANTTLVMLFEDHIEWKVLNTSDITGTESNLTANSLQVDVVNSVISITTDPIHKDIFFLDKDGLISRCPMSYPSDPLEPLGQYRAINAKKIEYDTFGKQLFVHDGSSIYVISRDGKSMAPVAQLTLNDFTLVPQLGLIIYVSDYEMKAINMDGTNDMVLFNSTRVKFTSVNVDYPLRRIFYTIRGMPNTTNRVISSKFDGSDKFRHYTISNNSVPEPVIHLFENTLFITDGSRQSIVYHGTKFPTKDTIYDKMIIMKLAINIAISNPLLATSPLSAHAAAPNDGVIRFARNEASTVSQLVQNINEDKVALEVVYRCSSGSSQTYKKQPDCTNTDCAMPILLPDSHKSIIRSGKSLTVNCNEGYYVPDVKSAMTSVYCDEQGVWSGAFQCVRVECPQLPRFQFAGITNVFDYSNIIVPSPGDIAFIECLHGTFYNGKSNVTL